MGEPEEPPVQQLAPLHSFSLIGSYEDMKAGTDEAPVIEEAKSVAKENEQLADAVDEANIHHESKTSGGEEETVTNVDLSKLI